MRFVIKGCIVNLKEMFFIPYSGTCKEIKIVGDKIYALTKEGSLQGWHLLNNDIQQAYKKFINEIDSILLGE